MTVAPNSTSSNVPENKTEKLSLSATQIAASGLAAVSATVAASFFGVAGTVIGAALGSVVSVVGSAVYSYSIRQTKQRVRQGLDVAVAQRFSVDHPVEGEAAPEPTRVPRRPGLKPRQLAVAAGALFVVTMGAVTGFELLSGKPLSATVSGSHSTGGTTFDHGATRSTTPKTISPASSASSSGSAGASSLSSTPAATVTVTQTESSTPSTSSSVPSASATSSEPTPSSTPSATQTGGSQPPAG